MVDLETKQLTGTLRCGNCECALFYFVIIFNKEWVICHDCGEVAELKRVGG